MIILPIWREISGNEGNDRISSSDENIIEIFLRTKIKVNISNDFHRFVRIYGPEENRV